MNARFTLSMTITATVIGLTAYPVQAQLFQTALYESPFNQSFSNIYQYPSSSGQSHSNIYQTPTVNRQPRYQQPRDRQPRDRQAVIYQQPSVIYRRTEVVSPDGTRRVILADPQYVVPNRNVIIHPDDRRSVVDHRRYHQRHRGANNYRRSNRLEIRF